MILNHFEIARAIKNKAGLAPKLLLLSCGVIVAAAALSACGNKEKKPGQALVSVNGEEITVLQLNDELQRAGVQSGQLDTARKQLLQSLIDRQLLQNEALSSKIDRDPQVLQSIERAKALILAQAYMQKRLGSPAKPSKTEVDAYFTAHPEFFTHRKQFDMSELVVASADMNDGLKAAMDSAKSLDEVATWLDSHKVKFSRAQLARTSAELPPELVARLQAMPKGQLFIIREGERSLLISIADIHDAPVTQEAAAPQIEQFLFNKKNKEAADAELARLRGAAKIDYIDKTLAPVAPAAAAGPASASAASSAGAANDRGVAGLK